MRGVDGRLEAEGEVLTREQFDIIDEMLGVTVGRAEKIAYKLVAAMGIVDVVTPVVTINVKDGTVQTENIAPPGDAIMTRLKPDGTPKYGKTCELDQWAVKADDLYVSLEEMGPFGQVVGGENEVYFVDLPKGGVVAAPWGGAQNISDGVVQYSKATGDVYLNEGYLFETTFVVIEPSVTINKPTGARRAVEHSPPELAQS